ncbi:Bacterial type II and III secretion system protein [Pirellulimonas nuda]|uniref:Bacterial type II and III secretion system protein n=1 Tax=Pirellulimonas nuda TaxID=2528009 RepID=A0A518D697_9BACT|nr:hypothetical protein [Pirellulimonas nuda]QDU86996.1 Bacterial type II and III secretion system protein [Pirellulimonas nuda]
MLLRTLVCGAVLMAVFTVGTQAESAAPLQQAPHPAGQAASPAGDAQQLLLQRKCAELDRLQREVAQLRSETGTPEQVLVRVQLVEVALTKLQQKGIDTDWFVQGRIDSAATATEEGDPASGVLRFIEGLKQNNLAKTLADPTLVVVSGRPASLHTGGELPIPASSNSNSAVDFLKFGTELEVNAVTLGNDRVRLELRTSVSEIDPSREVMVNGTLTPGLSVCRCDTSTELSLGQSVILTGLVTQRTEARRGDDGQVTEALVRIGTVLVVAAERFDPITSAAKSRRRPIAK